VSKLRSVTAVCAVALAIVLGLGVSACNTVEGLGKDISAAGRAMGADGGRRNN
jgi:predicted small secreted protein